MFVHLPGVECDWYPDLENSDTSCSAVFVATVEVTYEMVWELAVAANWGSFDSQFFCPEHYEEMKRITGIEKT